MELVVAVGRAIPEQSNNRIPLRDYFFYWYKGVNPFGQLREQSDFWFVGIGWTWGI